MPVKACQVNGKKGFKCGDEGKCYTTEEFGENAWTKACEQCTAMGEKCSDEDYGCSKSDFQPTNSFEGGETLDITKFRNTHIPIKMRKIGELDERFLEVKIYILHTGENFNGSFFEKEVVNRAIPSLANTPVLAFTQLEDKGKDFAGHEIDLVIEQGEYRWKYKGQAYGIIPESNNARWEMMESDDGVLREYLVCDALIWTKFDDAVEILNRDVIKGQSMELSEIYSGHFSEDGLFHFDQFKFDGCCMLGDVEPAMMNANVQVQFSKAKFKQEIDNMMKVYHSKFTKEGNEVLDNLLKEYGLTREQVVDAGLEIHNFNESNIDEFKKELERIKREADEQKNQPNDENNNEPQDNEDDNQNDKSDFDKKDNNKSEGGKNEPKDEEEMDEEGKKDSQKDFSDDERDKQKDEPKDEDDNDSKDNDESKEVQDELDELKKEYSRLKAENDELIKYKKNREKNDHKAKVEHLISSFEKLNDEDVKEIREKVFHFTIDEIEEKLFAILGKKQAGDKVKKQSNFAKFYVHDEDEKSKKKSSYDHLFEKHLK